MAEAPVRVGLLGYGFVGRTFHAPLVVATPGLELVAVASSKPELVRQDIPGASVAPDPQPIIDDDAIDLVIIATPNDSHAPLARAALFAGKHVVVEKPFTLDRAEARELAALAARNGLIVTVFHNRRWDSDFLTLEEILRSGSVGRPVQLESHFDRFRPDVAEGWRERGGPGSGIWYDLGSHLVDQALHLFGVPQTLSADLAQLRDGAQADDYAHAVLGYDGLRVILHATALAAAQPPRFVLHGTAGSFVIHGMDPQEDALKNGDAPGAPDWGTGAPDGLLVTGGGEKTVPRVPGDYRRFYLGLLDAMRDEGAPPVSADQALTVMRMLDAGRDSSASGRRLAIENAG